MWNFIPLTASSTIIVDNPKHQKNPKNCSKHHVSCMYYCYHQRNTAWLMSNHISFSSKSMGMKITNILLFVCPEKINYLSNLPHCHDFNIFPLVTLLIKLLMQLQLVDPHWNVICSKLSKVVYFSTKVLYKNYMKQVHLKFRKVDPPFKCCRF